MHCDVRGPTMLNNSATTDVPEQMKGQLIGRRAAEGQRRRVGPPLAEGSWSAEGPQQLQSYGPEFLCLN